MLDVLGLEHNLFPRFTHSSSIEQENQRYGRYENAFMTISHTYDSYFPPKGWMQMSAPNVSLYALTIMAQPSFEEEHPDINEFQRMHRMGMLSLHIRRIETDLFVAQPKVYLPCMHVLFALCLIGMVASVSSLIVRWEEFRKIPFSPAHAAFCAPCLSRKYSLVPTVHYSHHVVF